MNFRNASKTFLEVARQYQEDMDTARTYMYESNIHGRLKDRGVEIDVRDFLPMITVMGIQGDTKDERAKDIHQKLEELATAFADPDKEKRNDYLSLIYYMIDDFANDFDPVTMNMSDPAEVAKLLQSMMVSQTAVTKREENPEYYDDRYPEPQDRNLADACTRFCLAISRTVSKMLEDAGISIGPKGSLPKSLPDEAMDIHYLREDYEKGLLEEAKKTKGDLLPTTTVSFPILDSMVPCVGKDVRDIPRYSGKTFDLVKNYYTFLVESSLLLKGTKNTQGLEAAGIEKLTEAVYIDGKPFGDFVKAFDMESAYNGQDGVIIGTCILGGKHKVDIVNAYPDKTGQMQYEAKTVRITATPEQEEMYLQQFSRIRRSFNRWPFNIETMQEKMDRMANDPDTEARHAKVLGMHKEKIETGIQKNGDKLRQRKLSADGEANHRATYKDAKALLEATVARWDKDSVIGILGRQMTATYQFDGKARNGLCEAVRIAITDTPQSQKYDAMSPMFAKLVLYSQLCNERVANNGNPGELEMMLGNGDSVRENIENTAQVLAQDPVFKDLVLEKIGLGETPVPASSLYEKLIVNGGHKRFWMEYKQKMNVLDNQNEQQAPTNEVEMAQRKQKELQKTPM